MREAWTFTRFWLGVIVTSCLALAPQAQGTRKGVTQGCSLSSMRQVPGPIITATGNPVLDKKIDEELGLVSERFNVEPAFRIFQNGNTPNAFAVLENVMAGSSGTVLLFRRLKLPKNASLHSLRHTHGSHLLANGTPLPAVSKRLGHSSVYVTATVYAHAIDGQDEEAGRKWDEFQQRSTSPVKRV